MAFIRQRLMKLEYPSAVVVYAELERRELALADDLNIIAFCEV